METKHDICDLNDIIEFVNGFYIKVQHEDLIGPIFNEAIEDWVPHLKKMCAFWNPVLFGVPGFTGNPFARHAPLAIEQLHFDRWLLLFNQTIDDLFVGEMAAHAKQKAETMAIMFVSKLQYMKGSPARVIA